MPSSLSAAPPTAFHAAAAPPAIDVMFAVTSAWTVCLAVTLHSLARHSNPERNYRLWVVTAQDSCDMWDRLLRYFATCGQEKPLSGSLKIG